MTTTRDDRLLAPTRWTAVSVAGSSTLVFGVVTFLRPLPVTSPWPGPLAAVVYGVALVVAIVLAVPLHLAMSARRPAQG